ncbi:hypothetical protein ABZV78_14430 [Micromonospora sp. NPDC004540]|uniref:hypothetical protein n=1 Tax=Micromonospora sp. NPDC004540 TaxID=3154457 RepID=UPI0033A1D1F8
MDQVTSLVEALVGHRLASVTRLAWHQPGEPVELVKSNVGPVHLVFDGGRGLLVDGRSDWTLRCTETAPGDEAWLATYDYDWDGARWLPRDASAEAPFGAVIGKSLTDWAPVLNEVNELVGIELEFEGERVNLRLWEGELTT